MFCINCGQKKTKVTNSRQNKKTAHVWRRRQCQSCGSTFTTYESISLEQVTVVAGNTVSHFSHPTLLVSIAACFEHTPSSRAEHAAALTKTVETLLLQNGTKTSPKAICELTYDVLHRFDRLAGVQYAAKHASVLRSRLN